ncbi:MAG TPA: alpha-L-arabinofuranosidase C-terminal domain-containing protein, partial [Paludibacter sp.]
APAESKADSTTAFSCVRDSKSGDVTVKFVNYSKNEQKLKVDLSQFKNLSSKATQTILTGAPEAKNSFEEPTKVLPVSSDFKAGKSFIYSTKPMSLTVIRIKSKK